MITSNRYRNPDRLGARRRARRRRLGVRRADRRRAHRAGRDVTLAVGPHTRMPRRYRGLDIFWWLESDRPAGPHHRRGRRPGAARRETSLQLVGRNDPERAAQDLDLGGLHDARRPARRPRRLGEGRTARLRDDLAATVGAADAAPAPLPRQPRPLRRAGRTGAAAVGQPAPTAGRRRGAPDPPRPARRGHRHRAGGGRLPPAPPVAATADHRRRRDHPPASRCHPRRGVYVVGQRFQHRRDSGYIDGARHDAASVVPTSSLERVAVRSPLELSDAEEPAA